MTFVGIGWQAAKGSQPPAATARLSSPKSGGGRYEGRPVRGAAATQGGRHGGRPVGVWELRDSAV